MMSRKQNGYSLLEMMIAISILLIIAAVTDVSLQPVLKQEHVTTAFNLTISALRRARDQAVSDNQVYVVSFLPANPNPPNPNGGTITVNQAVQAGGVWTPGAIQLFSWNLSPDVTYNVEPNVPTSNTVAPTTPDSFGTAANAIDFDWGPNGAGGGTTIFFYPDGSARDDNGNINNGVIYLGLPNQTSTGHAVTVWGFTGRIRGWQVYNNNGAWTWTQQ
jgi:prepilin-type N-terminal cleavage/methylation domain-containing protein